MIIVDEFLDSHKDKFSQGLLDTIYGDYSRLRKHFSVSQANDIMGKKILENYYGSITDASLSKTFKIWGLNKIEEFYGGSISIK